MRGAFLFGWLLATTLPCFAQELTPPKEPEDYASFMRRTENLPPEEERRAFATYRKELDEYTAALKSYQNEKAAQQIKLDTETAASWSQSLERMSAGGWIFLEVAYDGQSAIFASRHQLMRAGPTVLSWFRWEYRHPQKWSGRADYLSMVERDSFDCTREVMRTVSHAAYAGNNLKNANPDESEVLDDKAKWSPVIPGSVGEELLEWACKNAPARAKTSPAQ